MISVQGLKAQCVFACVFAVLVIMPRAVSLAGEAASSPPPSDTSACPPPGDQTVVIEPTKPVASGRIDPKAKDAKLTVTMPKADARLSDLESQVRTSLESLAKQLEKEKDPAKREALQKQTASVKQEHESARLELLKQIAVEKNDTVWAKEIEQAMKKPEKPAPKVEEQRPPPDPAAKPSAPRSKSPDEL